MTDHLEKDDILLCAYEVARLEQIKKNKAFLASLGLEKMSETSVVPPPVATKPTRKRRASSSSSEVRAPKRRSARVANQPVSQLADSTEVNDEEKRHAKYEILVSLQNKHGGAKLPPRASYAHTVDRVLSMSEKALEARIKKIEQANGKYALLKQRMFAEVLIIEGFDELAKLAQASVLRLRAKGKKTRDPSLRNTDK